MLAAVAVDELVDLFVGRPALEPDVVVVDYRMPGLDGAQTTTEVLRASPHTRVVCLTASISRDETARILDAGAVACLTKDEDLEQIVASIHSAAATADA